MPMMTARFLRRTFVAPIVCLCLLALPLSAGPAQAQQTLRAAAVVNDQVISILDLEMRVRLAVVASGLEDTREQRQRIAPQVMRTLVDERLQLQEAERLGYDVTDEQVQQAVGQVASNNEMSRDAFISVLRNNDILPSVFFEQARASIAWQQIIQRRLRPEVEISDDEVDEVVERIRAQQGEKQYRMREIFLSVDQTAEMQQVRQTAQRLVQELQRGAEFPALARQFSQAGTAAVGGEIGWVTPSNLPESVAEAVTSMSPGQVAGPLESFNGVHIVKLMDTRIRQAGDASVDLKQVFLPVPDDGDREAAREQLTQYAQGIEGCGNVESVVEETDPARVSELTDIALADLPAEIRREIVELDIGQPSQPVEVTGGLAVLTVCARSGGDIDREQIRQNLVDERLNMIAQRYMRDLRRQAHIDIRVQL